MQKTMLIAIVAAFAFVQAASAETPTAPAAPPAATVPTPAPAPPVAPAPAAPAAVQAPVAQRREEVERPSLADRVKGFMTANAGTHALTAQISTLTGERDTARTQLAALTLERDNLRRELSDVEAALTGQQNLVRATATEIAQTVGMPLERLPAPQQTGSALEDLQDKLKGEQNAHKRSEIMAQIIALRDKK